MTVDYFLRTLPAREVEIHINDDTREARHCFTDQPLRFHTGFTVEDVAAGWRQAMAFSARAASDQDLSAEIERAKAEALSQMERHWLELAALPLQRVIHQGKHYTAHALGEGIGFGGEAFRVEWLAPGQEPTVCNLFAQGRIPAWMHDKLPDNARSIEDLGYRVDPFPDLNDGDIPY